MATYGSVEEMIRKSDMSSDFKGEVLDYMASRKTVRFLTAKRAAAGLCERELAGQLGWTTHKVHRFEQSADNDLKLGDLKSYACAVGCTVGLDVS